MCICIQIWLYIYIYMMHVDDRRCWLSFVTFVFWIRSLDVKNPATSPFRDHVHSCCCCQGCFVEWQLQWQPWNNPTTFRIHLWRRSSGHFLLPWHCKKTPKHGGVLWPQQRCRTKSANRQRAFFRHCQPSGLGGVPNSRFASKALQGWATAPLEPSKRQFWNL